MCLQSQRTNPAGAAQVSDLAAACCLTGLQSHVVADASPGLVSATQGCQCDMCLMATCLPLDVSAIVS